MQTTGRNIRCHQNIQITVSEILENTQTFFLRHIAGQQADTVAVSRQVCPDIFTAVFGIGENNAAVRPLFFQQCLEEAHFSSLDG